MVEEEMENADSGLEFLGSTFNGYVLLGSPNNGSGRKYIPWSLEAPWLCPESGL